MTMAEQKASLLQNLNDNIADVDAVLAEVLECAQSDIVVKIVRTRLDFLLDHFTENLVIETVNDHAVWMWPSGEANGTVVVGNESYSASEHRYLIGNNDLDDPGYQDHSTEEWESMENGEGSIVHYKYISYRIEKNINYLKLKTFILSLSHDNALARIADLQSSEVSKPAIERRL